MLKGGIRRPIAGRMDRRAGVWIPSEWCNKISKSSSSRRRRPRGESEAKPLSFSNIFKKNKCIPKKKIKFHCVNGPTVQKISEMPSQKNAEKNVIALGLDYNYKSTESAGKQWTPKDGLKVYFLTVRLRVDFSHENALELVASLRAHKQVKQMLLSIEKENAVGPCTHHVHAIMHTPCTRHPLV